MYKILICSFVTLYKKHMYKNDKKENRKYNLPLLEGTTIKGVIRFTILITILRRNSSLSTDLDWSLFILTM